VTRLVFDAVVAPPVDLDGVTTGWRLVGSSTEPTIVTGVAGSAQALDGTAAYEGQDAGAELLGLEALTLRLLVRPDFDALAGATATLVARGKGGPTVAEGWAYELRLAVAGDALSATLQLAWSDETLATVVHGLATFARPAAGAWTVLAVTREVTANGTLLRASVDGVPYAELSVTDQVPGTPGMPITLGCRRNGSGYDRFVIGDIEVAELDEIASSAELERLLASALLAMPAASLETVRDYWFQTTTELALRDSDYERYRLRPLAALLGEMDLAVDIRQRHGLAHTANGARLAAWERALGLPSGRGLSLAQRQERAASSLVLVEGISRTFLGSYATRILRTGDPLEVFETIARVEPDCLWLGTRTDLVTGTVLTPGGVAYEAEDNASVALSCPWGRNALALGHGLDNEFLAPNAAIGNVTSAEPVVVILGYVLRHFRAGVFSLLAGNRETATLNGWEIHISNTGQLRMLVDDGPNQTVVTLGTGSASLNAPHVVALVFMGGALTAASELATASGAFAFNPSSASPAGLGAYRATTPEVSPNWDCLFWGFIRGAAKVTPIAAAPQNFCQTLQAALVNGA
jgi:hypothetical protein